MCECECDKRCKIDKPLNLLKLKDRKPNSIMDKYILRKCDTKSSISADVESTSSTNGVCSESEIEVVEMRDSQTCKIEKSNINSEKSNFYARLYAVLLFSIIFLFLV